MHKIILFALVATAWSAPADFAPFDNWAADISAGNVEALRSLYRDGAQLSIGKSPADLQAETQFWNSLHSAGLKNLDAKVLSLKRDGDRETVVYRIQGEVTQGHFVIGGAQLWQESNGKWQIVVGQRTDPGIDRGRRLPEPAKTNPNLYPPPQAAGEEIAGALKQAAAHHKRVLVVFGANWCYDCHVLDNTFRSASFAPLVTSNYVVVHINIGDEGRDNNDVAQRYGVNLERGIPSLAVLEPSGKVLIAQQNGEFENTERIGPEDVRAFLERWKPGKAR